MSTTIRVRSNLTRRASGKYDTDDTVEITTDDLTLNVAGMIREIHQEVNEEQRIEIIRREHLDSKTTHSTSTTSLRG